MSDGSENQSGASVSVINPFSVALKYYRNHWYGTVPVPYKQKHPPPIGFTGHAAKYPEPQQVKEWMDQRKQNIALRLAGVDDEHEIIGIDVDHYTKGDKEKRGGDQLEELETRLGPLPATWISSARTDGFSGIRYFRVPRGMAFRGQVEKDIECISKGYRFAVVWPSKHPDGGVYWWYPPGVPPVAGNRDVWDSQIPNAEQLPLLPDAWLNYLTQGKTLAGDEELIDMDSSVDEMYAWAKDIFHGDEETEPCSLMREKLEFHKKRILEEATSHDKITNAHWNLVKLASEGHHGLFKALQEVEVCFHDETLRRDKRDEEEIRGEVFRSMTNALRKIKAKCDERIKMGAQPVDVSCTQTGACGGTVGDALGGDGSGVGDGSRALKPVPDYEMNDYGNAEHFYDMFGGAVHYIEGYGWMVWKDGSWVTDLLGNDEMHRLWQHVRQRQSGYVDALEADYENQLRAAMQGGQNTTGVNAPAALIAARVILQKWKKFHEDNGNQPRFERMLKALKGFGVQLDIGVLNKNPLTLGVANGVIELDYDTVRLRDARPDDFITLNTGVEYGDVSELARQKWNEYLDTFIPDLDYRKCLQVHLGYGLIGGNPQQVIVALNGQTNTGKSTLLAGIKAAMGQYATSVDQSMFQNTSHFNEDLADAMDKRYALCSEFDRDAMSAASFKRFSGEDEIGIRIKNSMARKSGHPKFLTLIATNKPPKISGADKALRKRLRVFSFEVTPKKIDASALNVIESICGSAVLQWLVEGYMEFRRIGELPGHRLIDEATDEFMSELDEVAAFAHEALIKHGDIEKPKDWKQLEEWTVKRSDMYTHFKKWWQANGYQERERPSAKDFTLRLAALGVPGTVGVKSARIGVVVSRWWFGVKLAKIDGDAGIGTVIPMNLGKKP